LRIRLNDPALVPDLLAFLSGRVDCVVEQVGQLELEAGLLGSYNIEEHDLRLDLLVREWQAPRPEAIGEFWASRSAAREEARLTGRGSEPWRSGRSLRLVPQ
jgi:hypothetical protein